MGKLNLLPDAGSANKDKVIALIAYLKSRDVQGKFLEVPGPDRIIYVTDNIDSASLSEANKVKLKSALTNDVTGYRGLQQSSLTSSDGKQRKPVLFINFEANDGKPPLNILVHEIGHDKWPGLGVNENHDDLFYKLLDGALR